MTFENKGTPSGEVGEATTAADGPLHDSTESLQGELPLVLVRSHEYNYSETFVEDHVNHLSSKLTLLYGWPFPRYLKGQRSVLTDSREKELQAAISPGGAVSAELWKGYSTELASFLKKSGVRVVLLESGVMGAFAYWACEMAGIPYVVHFHGVDAVGREILNQWKAHYDRFFRSAAACVVVSKAMQSQLLKLGAPSDRIVLAPYGVSTGLPRLAAPAQAGPRFIAVGRFVEKKAPQNTLQAFALVHSRVPEAQLVMVGDGPLLKLCQQWAETHGLAGAVTFAGVQSRAKVSRLMAGSRVFVQHSIVAANGDSEGLPLAVLEAGAHGLPVVATRHAGIPDAVTDGTHGYLVPEGDVKQMAERMLLLAHDAALAGRLGAAFRERVCAEFSRKVSIGRLQKILASAAAGQPMSTLKSPVPRVSAEVESELGRVRTADQAMALADDARRLQNTSLLAECLQAALSLDRNCHPAYLQLADILSESGDDESTYLCLKEASRVAPLPAGPQALLDRLAASPIQGSELLQAYREQIGGRPVEQSPHPRRILVVTNLFPPQELGGYGRTMWEFCDLFLQRGHQVLVLTADCPEWHRPPDPGMDRLESHVDRSLRLFGTWINGGAVLNPDRDAIKSIAQANTDRIDQVISSWRPDSIVAGNLDFLGYTFIKLALRKNLPVLHRLGNAGTSYPPDPAFESPLFCLAGNTEWLNQRLKDQGYKAGHWSVVYPGSPLEHYYRAFAPRFDVLRIAYASIFASFKGPHILFEALGILARSKVPFSLECAGETPDPAFKAQCEQLSSAQGFADRIRWHGFLNRDGLSSLFARCNTLVFPSVFDEPFGKTQIEAMSAGLAVVSSGTGGTREIVHHLTNGLLFKSQNPEDLARQLFSLHRDHNLWSRLASQGQSDAFRFTSLQSVSRIEDFFDQIHAGSR